MSLKMWFSGFLKREVVASLDKRVLDAARSRLSPDAQAIWDEQVIRLGRCQVIPVLGTEVDYWYRSGEPPRSYPYHEREVRRLAMVRFRCDGIEYKARPKEREALLRQRQLCLPPDYLELLEQCDGFSSQEHTVLGVASMYELSIEEEVYWLLAKRGGTFLVPKEGDTQPRVYCIHHEDGVPNQEFTSFREALDYLLTQPNLP